MDLSRIDLPLVPFLPRISALLEEHHVLALTAEPGAGKSTLVPPFLLGASWLGGRKVIMLEPRRLAATAIASRIADLLGEPVGRRAGYRVRTSTRVSQETRIEVVTEALLTRMIQEDPLLEGAGCVIIDEFHERSIHADLALALALEVRRARQDLAVLVMSATLETERVSRLLEPGQKNPSAILRCPGRSFPVKTLYRPVSVLPSASARGWEEGFASGVAELFDDSPGDILAFVPGAAEIRRVAGRLGGLLAGRAEVLGLHGLLPLAEQRRIAARESGSAGAGLRRVIVSTSIAETSLTVPGVRTVADSGWSRLSRFHPATGLDRLVTERVSQSSADQRRGRAARLGPGVCVRFWSESEKIPPNADPEILRSDLSGLVLECALWGARDPAALAWMDAPPASAWAQAWETLRMLGLVTDRGPTALGRTVAGLGLPPRLGVLVLRGADSGSLLLTAACAALLEERDSSGLTGDPDVRLRLELLRQGSGAQGGSAQGGSDSWRRAVMTETGRILRRMGRPLTENTWRAEEEARVGDLLAYAFPDRLARREPDGTYRLVTGRVARFPSAGRGAQVHVASRAATPWVAAIDADAGETSGLIRLAAPVSAEAVDRVLAAVAAEQMEIRWEGLVSKGAMVRRAGRITLSERPVRPSAEQIAASFRERLSRDGLGILPWNETSQALLARLRFFARARPEAGLGDLSDAGLAERSVEWLEPFLKLDGGHVIGAEKLRAALQGILGNRAAQFRVEAPESITLPTGGKRRIDYSGDAPAVEARIQEVFGLSESPLICGVRLTFRLLSPAHRPLQVTRDLAGFWRSTYADVRKEMRGRYPKHYWPEDPLRAEPTSRVRPRR
ncbi:MAG: ATP-dependent helicase HrpB [Spirochaetia bacterium]